MTMELEASQFRKSGSVNESQREEKGGLHGVEQRGLA